MNFLLDRHVKPQDSFKDSFKNPLNVKDVKTFKTEAPKADINRINMEMKHDTKAIAKTNKNLVEDVLKDNQAAAEMLSNQLEAIIKDITNQVTTAVAGSINTEIKVSFTELTSAMVKALTPFQLAGITESQRPTETSSSQPVTQGITTSQASKSQSQTSPTSPTEPSQHSPNFYTETQLPAIPNTQQTKKTPPLNDTTPTQSNTDDSPSTGHQLSHSNLMEMIKSQPIQIDNLLNRIETLEGKPTPPNTLPSSCMEDKTKPDQPQLKYSPTIPIDMDGNTLPGQTPDQANQPIDFTEVKTRRKHRGPRPNLSETTNAVVNQELIKHYEE